METFPVKPASVYVTIMQAIKVVRHNAAVPGQLSRLGAQLWALPGLGHCCAGGFGTRT